MDDPIAVRPGVPADHAEAVDSWAEAMVARAGQPPAPERRERLRQVLTRPGSFLVVAVEGSQRVVGMALGMPALEDDGEGPPIPGHCHVSAVFVRPEWWGRRLGGRLVDAVLAAAVGRGYRTAQLWTQADNERALRLYASRGFIRSGRTKTVDDEPIVHLTLAHLAAPERADRDPGPGGGTRSGVAGLLP